MTNRRTYTVASAMALIALAGIGLTGCASPGTTPAPTLSTSVSTSLVAPIMVELKTANGTSVTVPLTNVVDLLTGDTTVTDWKGVVADPKVATFIAGAVENGATFNPGLSPKALGMTKVTVTNAVTGAVVTFDLTVTQ